MLRGTVSNYYAMRRNGECFGLASRVGNSYLCVISAGGCNGPLRVSNRACSSAGRRNGNVKLRSVGDVARICSKVFSTNGGGNRFFISVVLGCWACWARGKCTSSRALLYCGDSGRGAHSTGYGTYFSFILLLSIIASGGFLSFYNVRSVSFAIVIMVYGFSLGVEGY